jgi:hypothetical protein
MQIRLDDLVNDSIFKPTFTDLPSFSYSASFGCYTASLIGSAGIGIELKTSIQDPNGPEPQVLVSSVFFNIGPDNLDDFKFVIYPAVWDAGINWWEKVES